MSKSSRKRARRRERNRPEPEEIDPEQARQIRENIAKKVEKAHRPLFDFLEEKVTRCNELDAKLLSEGALSEGEQVELDLLRRLEIKRFAILSPIHFSGNAKKPEYVEWRDIANNHRATRQQLIEQVKSGKKLNVHELRELKFADEIDGRTRRAGTIVGKTSVWRHRSPDLALEALLGPESSYADVE